MDITFDSQKFIFYSHVVRFGRKLDYILKFFVQHFTFSFSV